MMEVLLTVSYITSPLSYSASETKFHSQFYRRKMKIMNFVVYSIQKGNFERTVFPLMEPFSHLIVLASNEESL